MQFRFRNATGCGSVLWTKLELISESKGPLVYFYKTLLFMYFIGGKLKSLCAIFLDSGAVLDASCFFVASDDKIFRCTHLHLAVSGTVYWSLGSNRGLSTGNDK